MIARRPLLLSLALGAGWAAPAQAQPPVEPHQRLDTRDPAHAQDIPLTLDACSGAFDAALVDTLVQRRIPATLFVTARWLARNPDYFRSAKQVKKTQAWRKAHPDYAQRKLQTPPAPLPEVLKSQASETQSLALKPSAESAPPL